MIDTLRKTGELLRHRLSLPLFFAVGLTTTIFVGDLMVHALVSEPSRLRSTRLADTIALALVTGGVIFALTRKLIRSGERYRILATGTRDLIFFVGHDRTILDANDAAARAYGWSRRELIGASFKKVCADDPVESCAVEAVLGGMTSILTLGRHRRRDGSTFEVEVSASRGTIGRQPIVMVVARDITQRRRREDFDRLLHDIDRAILRGEPLDAILSFVVHRMSLLYPGALVQISMKGESGSVDIRHFAGDGTGFLEGINVRWDDSPEGRGPTGTAIRTGDARFSRLEDDPDFLPWRERALAQGFKFAAAVPLTAHGSVLGALTLFTRPGVLDEDGLAALQGFADQVAISVLSAQTVEKLELQRVALDSAANAVVLTDRHGVIRWVNPAFTLLTGFPSEEAIGKTPRILKSGNHGDGFYRQMWTALLAGETWHGELYNRRKDGHLYLEEQTITPVRGSDGSISHFVAIKVDITARKHQEEQIRHLAMHDALTGLPNRRLLSETLSRATHQARRGRRGALLIIDIDNFKVVNDSLGHAAGDRLLAQLAELIPGVLRPGDFVARFGGDEFAVLIEGTDFEDALATARRLHADLQAFRFRFGGSVIEVGASIGITEINGDVDPDSLMVQADSALYAAKEQGRNRIVEFHPGSDWSTRLIEASQWASRIREALRDDGFDLAFQPVVNLTSGDTEHYEALLRLRAEDGSLIPPDRFLRAAERFGLMPQIDRWVVARVASLLGRRRDLRVFVNLAAASLADESLLELIAERLRTLDIEPGRLAFEITEATAITDVVAAQNWIRRVKDLGCLFALDDFGVGFSSLAYLRALSVDYVKIDRSFVNDVHIDVTSRALVQAVKTVALTLGKEVIAEGVEHAEHAAVLREIGIEHGQGYHWGQPSTEPQQSRTGQSRDAGALDPRDRSERDLAAAGS